MDAVPEAVSSVSRICEKRFNMRMLGVRVAILAATILTLSQSIFGQAGRADSTDSSGVGQSSQSAQYRAAADAYNNAAARCQNPAGAACMRNMANYNVCLANRLSGGGSCTRPTCSTACIQSTSSGSGTSFSPTMLPSTSPTSDAVVNAIGLFGQILADRNAKKEAREEAERENARESDADKETREASLAAAQESQRNAEASEILMASNNMLGITDPNSEAARPNTSTGTAASINSLLDPSRAPSNVAADISSVLDYPTSEPIDSTSKIAALLDASDTESTVSAVTLNASPTGPNADAIITSMTPQNPLLASAFQNAQDSPIHGNAEGELEKNLSEASDLGPINDGLQGIYSKISSSVAAVKTTISDLMSSPAAQWIALKDMSTIPLPKKGDSPELVTDKVFGQAIVGFNEFADKSPLKAIYHYNKKMIDQGMAVLGLAAAELNLEPATSR